VNKALFILLLAPILCSGQNFSVGLGVSANRLEQLGFTGGASVIIRKYSALKVEVSMFPSDSIDHFKYDITESSWNFNTEFLHHFLKESFAAPYIIGGIGLTSLRRDIYDPVNEILLKQKLTKMGLIYGLGVEFGFHIFKPYSEIKLQTATQSWVIFFGCKVMI